MNTATDRPDGSRSSANAGGLVRRIRKAGALLLLLGIIAFTTAGCYDDRYYGHRPVRGGYYAAYGGAPYYDGYPGYYDYGPGYGHGYGPAIGIGVSTGRSGYYASSPRYRDRYYRRGYTRRGNYRNYDRGRRGDYRRDGDRRDRRRSRAIRRSTSSEEAAPLRSTQPE